MRCWILSARKNIGILTVSPCWKCSAGVLFFCGGDAAVGGPFGGLSCGGKHFAAALARKAAQSNARPLQWGLHPVLAW